MGKSGYIILGIVAVIVVLIFAYFGIYNSIVSLEEKVDTAQSNIKVQLERRADLIPNLINTIKGYMDHEEKIIKEITDAREKMTNANKSGNITEMSEANDSLTTALSNLNVVVENYPDLKASQNFINLQDELAGTENRIATARKDYNDAVNEYNTKIKTMPSSIIASMMGKEKKAYFEVSDKTKEVVPEVGF